MKMKKWISATSQLPEIMEKVLIVTDKGFITVTQRYDETQGGEMVWSYADDRIMYWMKIPPINDLVGVEENAYLKETAS